METNNIQTRKDEIRFFTNKPDGNARKISGKTIIKNLAGRFCR